MCGVQGLSRRVFSPQPLYPRVCRTPAGAYTCWLSYVLAVVHRLLPASMARPKGSQAERAPCPIGCGAAGVDNRAAASPQDVVFVAAHGSEDGDHDHEHTQRIPPTPPTCQEKQACPQPPVSGCSDERAATPTIKRAANSISTAGESPAGASTAHHGNSLTPGTSPSATSPSADAVGAIQEREGDRCKIAENETPCGGKVGLVVERRSATAPSLRTTRYRLFIRLPTLRQEKSAEPMKSTSAFRSSAQHY